MPNPQKLSESSYAGFLNGYIAGNLSANAQELHLHKDKIAFFINEIEHSIRDWNLSSDDEKQLVQLLEKVNQLNFENNIDYYFELGELLIAVVSGIKSIKPEIPTNTEFSLRKVIYHFLNITKTIRNTKVAGKAKELVEKFEKADVKP